MYAVQNVYSAEAFSQWESGGEVNATHRLPDTSNDSQLVFEPVTTFTELCERVAFLQLMNKRHVLYFRGLDKRSLVAEDIPSIFRPTHGRSSETLATRWQRMKAQAAIWREMLDRSHHPRPNTLRHYPEAVWAIQQHYKDGVDYAPYGVVGARTPYLDITQSLRIAALFATTPKPKMTEDAVITVLAMPLITGSLTYCADDQLQLLRLSALCPPAALRPFAQEAFLVARFPMPEVEQLEAMASSEPERLRQLVSARRRTVAYIPICGRDASGGFPKFWTTRTDHRLMTGEVYDCGWFEKLRNELLTAIVDQNAG